MKVRYLPSQPHCFAFGGFDLQMLHTLEAVKKLGINVEKLNPWDRDNDFDIIHLWGLDASNFRAAYFAKQERKKIVLTALTGYVKGAIQNFKLELFNKLQLVNYEYELIKLLDCLVVLNQGQADAAHKFYKIPLKKIKIVPAIINDQFFKYGDDDVSIKNEIGINDFVLCTGNVGKRKNQLNLAKACIRIGKPLVIIGNLASGEYEYGDALNKIVETNKNVYWIKEISNYSNIFISAYKACSMFVLISHDEQQPISPLEAAVIGKPIILANKTYAKQEYFKNAILVNPNSINEITDAITSAYINPHKYMVDKSKLNDFKSEIVGQKYKMIYSDLF